MIFLIGRPVIGGGGSSVKTVSTKNTCTCQILCYKVKCILRTIIPYTNINVVYNLFLRIYLALVPNLWGNNHAEQIWSCPVQGARGLQKSLGIVGIDLVGNLCVNVIIIICKYKESVCRISCRPFPFGGYWQVSQQLSLPTPLLHRHHYGAVCQVLYGCVRGDPTSHDSLETSNNSLVLYLPTWHFTFSCAVGARKGYI